jgi:hypothetical protein
MRKPPSGGDYGDSIVADAICILATILFFLLCAWYVHGCEKLHGGSND